MEWLKKITDIIMPLEPLPDEEEEEVKEIKKTDEQSFAPMMQQQEFVGGTGIKQAAAAGGGAVAMNFSGGGDVVNTSDNGTMSMGGMRYTAYATQTQAQTVRPNLSVVKNAELAVKIYSPTNFDEVSSIADDILGKKAAVVNYEYVNGDEQRRICDFVNGVCYVTNGMAEIISEKIVLYVPDGVDAESVKTMTARH